MHRRWFQVPSDPLVGFEFNRAKCTNLYHKDCIMQWTSQRDFVLMILRKSAMDSCTMVSGREPHRKQTAVCVILTISSRITVLSVDSDLDDGGSLHVHGGPGLLLASNCVHLFFQLLTW